MPITINGSTGVAGIEGSAGTPSVQGADTNTGVFFPAADTVALSTGGTERMVVDSVGNVGIGVTPTAKLHVNGSTLIAGSLNVSSEIVTTSSFSGSASSLYNLYNKGIEVLSPGSQVRWKNDTGVNATETKGTLTTYTIIGAPIMQFGTIRVAVNIVSAGSGVKVYRIDSGSGLIMNPAGLVGTLLATYSTTGAKTLDVSVEPGDFLYVIAQAQSNTITVNNCRLQTNGEDFWASPVPVNYNLGFDGNRAP